MHTLRSIRFALCNLSKLTGRQIDVIFLSISYQEAGWDKTEEKERRIERIRSVLFIERKGMKYVEKTIPSLDPVPPPHR
jgi:hypothetical protein